jgi:hypothetical protein
MPASPSSAPSSAAAPHRRRGSITGGTSLGGPGGIALDVAGASQGPRAATAADVSSHTMPVAAVVPLHTSLTLNQFEDVLGEAIYYGAQLAERMESAHLLQLNHHHAAAAAAAAASAAASGADAAGSAAALQGAPRPPPPAGSPEGVPTLRLAGVAAGGGAAGAVGAGGGSGSGGPGTVVAKEQHPKEEAKLRAQRALVRARKLAAQGYFQA